MPETLEEFAKEAIAEILKALPAEERLKGLPVEERLKGLPAAQRIEGLSVDELLAALTPEKRAALAQRLKDAGNLPTPPAEAPESGGRKE